MRNREKHTLGVVVGARHTEELKRHALQRKQQGFGIGDTPLDPDVQQTLSRSHDKTVIVEGASAFMCVAGAVWEALIQYGAREAIVSLFNIRTLEHDDTLEARKQALLDGLEYHKTGLSRHPGLRIVDGSPRQRSRRSGRSRRKTNWT